MQKYFFFGVMIIYVMNSTAMEQPRQLYGDEISLYSQGRPVTKLIMDDVNQSIYISENDAVMESIKKLDMRFGKELHTFEQERVYQRNNVHSHLGPLFTDVVCYQEMIMVGTERGEIKIWNVHSKNFVKTLTVQDKKVRDLAILKTTNKLCSVLNKGIKIWDMGKGICEKDIGNDYYSGFSRGCIVKNGIIYVADTSKVSAIDEKSDNIKELLKMDCGWGIRAIADNENNSHQVFVSILNEIMEFDIRNFNLAKPVSTIKSNDYGVSALRVFDGKLYVGRLSETVWLFYKRPYSGIEIFDIKNMVNPEIVLPGKGVVNHLGVNRQGVFVASEQGLTYFPALK